MTTREAADASGARGRRRGRRKWLAIAAGLLAAVLVLGYADVSYAVYDGLSKADGGCWPEARTNTPEQFTVDAKWGDGLAQTYKMPKPQDVTFHSRDAAIANTPLAAWWIPAAAASAPAVVVVHGIMSCRREASVMLAAGMLHKGGYSVFVMDMRNHGDSGFSADRRIAGGSVEYLDVLGGWDWVRSQGVPADRIGIVGFSLGSAVVLIAGGEEPAVRAVWADSSFTTTSQALALFLHDQLTQQGSPLAAVSDTLMPGAVLWGRANGIDLLRFDPVAEVAKYQGRHLAFAHGADDAVLPASMATTNHDAAAAAGARVADVFVVSGAGHTEAVYKDPAGYEARLVAFFGEALAQGAS
ncbi:MAG: alpha/beta hydrolase [Candidatus Limnocylindrales bacterium]